MIMKNIVILGAGGFGRELYHWIRQNQKVGINLDWEVKGFLDPNKGSLKEFVGYPPILGDEKDYLIQEGDFFLSALGNVALKKRVVDLILRKEGNFEKFIHHTAVVSSSSKVGKGVVICPHAIVSSEAVLGSFVMLNLYASCGHDTEVGSYSILSPYATLNGFSKLGEEVFLGSRATVLAGKIVGEKSKISAHAVLDRNAPNSSFTYTIKSNTKSIFFGGP